MKLWTYEEAKMKLLTDLDLIDETFITPNELIGYFNEGLSEAEAEIQALNQDYFLTKAFLAVTQAVSRYDLPENIYANKIRNLIYSSGALQYEIAQIRRKSKFELMDVIDKYSLAEWYSYLLVNNGPGQAKIEFHPPMRDTAIMPPSASASTPITLWYIRNCARIPLVADENRTVGEFCNPEVINPTNVDATANTIQTYAGNPANIGIEGQGVIGGFPGSIAYVTGDIVKFKKGPGGTLPAPLVEGTNYYVIQTGSGVIKLASSLALALAGTALDLTTAGTVFFVMTVAATENIVNATLIDIPEYITFVLQWAKCRCMEKEGDPRFEEGSQVLLALKKQMIDTLGEGIQDDDNQIQPDFSAYNEMS